MQCSVNRKRKKKNKAEEVVETVERVEEKEEEVKDTRTPAEKAYAAVQAKRVSSLVAWTTCPCCYGLSFVHSKRKRFCRKLRRHTNRE